MASRRLRTRTKKFYNDDDDDQFFEEVLQRSQTWKIEEKFATAANYRGQFVETLTAEEFNLSYVQRTGFPNPVLIKQHRGLGLRVPTAQFTVHHVRSCVGSQRLVNVMNVDTQQSSQMTMKAWTEYFDQPAEKRSPLLNVISLEFSHTNLENYVESPEIVRQLDWTSTAWPRYWLDVQAECQTHLKQEHMYYPKTRKYALMSVSQCFTDFHIDMGGSSVWYHVVKGKKVFWLLPPSESHLRLYEEWLLAGRQNECFFADLCQSTDCHMIILEAGWTFFLPSGWIHAVYTLEDSLVFGGNFLNSFKIPMQILVWNIERKVRVPDRFRYPYFLQSMWYVMERYVHSLTGLTHIAEDCLAAVQDEEKKKEPIDFADLKPCQLRLSGNNNHAHRPLTSFELEGLRTLCTLLRKFKDKSIPEDLVQPQQLFDSMERLLVEHSSDNSDAAIIAYNYYSPSSTNSEQNETELPQGIKRKNPPMHPSFHSSPTPNIVTLHPSATILLSGPLASSNYYPPQHYVNNYNPYPTTSQPVYPSDKTITAKDRHKRVRCKQCEPCCRDDCSECVHCKDMPKFGGVGKMKQCCLTKQCIAPILPSTASCQVCSKKKGSRKLSQLKPEEILYECERCMEIHHLPCFHSTHTDLSGNEGVFSDDIPETWLCPKCISANTPEPPLYKLRPIVRRTLVMTNKGKNGLIELPYSDPAQHYHPHPHPYANEMHQFHPIYGSNMHFNPSNEFHADLYATDPYETMENEAKKRRLYTNMYAPSVHSMDASSVNVDPPIPMVNHLVGLDDLSQSLNDSDLYVPQMFAV